MRRTLLIALIAALDMACCTSKLKTSAEFRLLPLEEKIAEYSAAHKNGCLVGRAGTYFQYLDMISGHGLAAADAMAKLVNSPQPDFPIRDVIIVASFINANGTELRGHPLYDALKSLAATHPDPEIRESARKCLVEIETKKIVP